jgi:SAM-dependent methyltransferase
MPAKDATQRFTERVANYVRYRPGYPIEILELLKNECGLTSESVVADIAFGTGIFTRMLLENGNRVIGVEPNAEMRRAGEQFVQSFSSFTSVAGTAEATTLPEHSVDLITAAQAAHWFDRKKARNEFVRIGKLGAWTVLLWNERRTDSTPFLRDYESLLLTYGTDYREVRHERTTDEIAGFFAPTPFRSGVFKTNQEVDYTGLEGRLLSSSYAPLQGHANYEAMLRELRRIFDAHQINDRVLLEYNTLVYYGQLE